MTSRYGKDLYDTAISDVVIGALTIRALERDRTRKLMFFVLVRVMQSGPDPLVFRRPTRSRRSVRISVSRSSKRLLPPEAELVRSVRSLVESLLTRLCPQGSADSSCPPWWSASRRTTSSRRSESRSRTKATMSSSSTPRSSRARFSPRSSRCDGHGSEPALRRSTTPLDLREALLARQARRCCSLQSALLPSFFFPHLSPHLGTLGSSPSSSPSTSTSTRRRQSCCFRT